MFAAMGLAAALVMPQDADRWSQATVAPYFADGRLQGCSINFKSVQRDNLYFGGRPVGADGSLNVYHFGGSQVIATIKVAVMDGEALRAPDKSYLVNGYTTNVADLITSRASPTDPSYTVSSFSFANQTADALGSILAQSSMTVGVQMNGGQSAIPFQVELTETQLADWSSCMDALTDGIQAAIGPGQ
jgi:hypothetical protein